MDAHNSSPVHGVVSAFSVLRCLSSDCLLRSSSLRQNRSNSSLSLAILRNSNCQTSPRSNSGADLLAVLPWRLEDPPRLAVFVPKLAPADDALWTNPPGRAALVERLLSTEAGPIDSEPLSELHWQARIVSLGQTPLTYVFHTADGAVGLLRITMPAEPLTTLQFRYRLVD